MIPFDFLVVKRIKLFHQHSVLFKFQIKGIDVNPKFKNCFEQTEQVFHFPPLQFLAPNLGAERHELAKKPNFGKPNDVVSKVVNEATNCRIRFQDFQVKSKLLAIEYVIQVR